MKTWVACIVAVVTSSLGIAKGPAPIEAHPEWDAAYTRAIREATTDPSFLTELVDHLPASPTVPSPFAVNGYIAGAPDRLTYAADVAAYMRRLAAASPRVAVFTVGTSEEGREMIAVAVADERLIASLDTIKAAHRRLADPRTCPGEEAARLVASTPPVYLVTGALHSPETGSPEMLMELAYRLAVEDTPFVRAIRENVVTLIVPVVEVDGRERMVDIARWAQQNPAAPVPPLAYWGRYVAHDNNRDGMALSLALTRNIVALVRDWRPQVFHDLHESVPFLYISGSEGPVNAAVDPLLVAEWDRLATHEMQALTAQGVPGVWFHGFADNWSPSYLDWVGTWHNGVGRFYETFGNHLPTTERRVVRGMSERAWYRQNPPLPEVRWSLRNNVNVQQSGVLYALSYAATNRTHLMDLFWQLGSRAVAKARVEGPAAYVFPADQPRQGQLADLLALLDRHGIEVQVTTRDAAIRPLWPPATPTPAAGRAKEKDKVEGDEGKAAKGDEPVRLPAGSFVVRMDQPLSRLADALLDTQYVKPDESVYDDTGWTLPLGRNVACSRIVNPEILAVPMQPYDGRTAVPPALAAAGALLVANQADTALVRLRVALPGQRLLAAEREFSAGARKWPQGTVIVPLAGADPSLAATLARLRLRGETVPSLPDVATHELRLPRVALLHTWIETQDEGWYRLALEDLGVPYAYISTQTVAADANLRGTYDVILFPPAGGASLQDIINGLPPGPPLPWRRTAITPNLGVDETDDMRPGLGFGGVLSLVRFVEQGGVLLAFADTASFAARIGLAPFVRPAELDKVKAPGTLLRGAVTDAGSPLAWGYDRTVPVYFAGDEAFEVGMPPRRHRDERGERATGRGVKGDPDVPQGRRWMPVPPEPTPGPGEEGFMQPENLPRFRQATLPRPEDRPRVIVAADKDAGSLLLSGMLGGADELAGKPLVVDAPRGAGHVVLFAINPMWRGNTQGAWALVSNAILNAGHLDLGRPAPAPAATAK